MNKIKLLPSNIINEIAAGEVIERPVAVVKELIENSIDAKSTRISVNIVSGGLSKIIVTDNGAGIDKKYIEISIQKHTTSKLKNKEIMVFIVASDNPTILKDTSAQLTVFSLSSFKSVSVVRLVICESKLHIKDSLKKPFSIPKW